MTKFIFVRHAETNYKALVGTNLETKPDYAPLSIFGMAQMKNLVQKDLFNGAQALICSPYTRTMQSAAFFSNELDLPLNVEPDLHEWNPDIAGKYSVNDLTENPKLIETIFYKAVADYRKGEKTDKEYEALYNVKNRVTNILNKFLGFDKVIVVTHGSVMSIFSETEHKPATVFEYEM